MGKEKGNIRDVWSVISTDVKQIYTFRCRVVDNSSMPTILRVSDASSCWVNTTKQNQKDTGLSGTAVLLRLTPSMQFFQ